MYILFTNLTQDAKNTVFQAKSFKYQNKTEPKKPHHHQQNNPPKTQKNKTKNSQQPSNYIKYNLEFIYSKDTPKRTVNKI